MKIIKLILFGLFAFFFINAKAEISIGIVMPDNELDGVSPDAYQLLASKVEKMLSSAGVTSNNSDFIIYPTVDVVEENLIEGGIKNFFKVKIDLTLKVANIATKTVFASEVWTLSGTSERVRSTAVKNAFTKLKGTDGQFKNFIEDAKQKINNYYESNKANILANANSLASTGNLEEAIALLSSYPSTVNGYTDALDLMMKIHTQYTNANAAKILNEANAAFAVKDYASAVELASQIDAQSSHYNDAKSLINKVRNTINKEEAAKQQQAMAALKMAADVEKAKINAAASVAKAYYGRRVVKYNIVRLY